MLGAVAIAVNKGGLQVIPAAPLVDAYGSYA